MHRVCLLSSLLLASCASLAAHADTFSTFDINGSSVFYGLGGDTNTVTGTTTIDITTGVVQSISFTAGNVFESGVDLQSGPIVYVGADRAKISFDAGSLINYMGSAFDINGPNDLYVGHGTMSAAMPAAASAPEPSTFTLIGTGLLGVAGVVRRRFARLHDPVAC